MCQSTVNGGHIVQNSAAMPVNVGSSPNCAWYQLGRSSPPLLISSPHGPPLRPLLPSVPPPLPPSRLYGLQCLSRLFFPLLARLNNHPHKELRTPILLCEFSSCPRERILSSQRPDFLYLGSRKMIGLLIWSADRRRESFVRAILIRIDWRFVV